MNLVVVTDTDNVLNYASDVVELDAFPDSSPELLVSLEGIPGPAGDKGEKGDKGDTGSLGDVNAIPPLYYSPSLNTIYLDSSVFEIAGAANLAIQAAKNYTDALVSTKPSKYVHNQLTASSIWNITHNLNGKPSVSIVDSANRAVFGDIVYDDFNSLHVSFLSAFSGAAYLVF